MIDNKFDIKIGDFGFVLGRHTKLLTHLYARDEAPAFVNKFSSGDPNYRDATFFSTWVQLDWLNGFNQEFFDDPSRFYYSEGIDTSKLQQLTLEKAFNSTGQAGTSGNIKTEVAWRTPATTYFGTGADGALTISADTTESPIDSACSGTQGSNTLAATNAGFTAGQEILIHQTRGTNAGTWQRTKIASYTAGTITTTNPLTISYASSGANCAQVRVIPQYTDVTIQSGKTYTAKAWDGTVGGILCFIASGTVNIAGTINANGKGFRGGNGASGEAQAYSGEGTTGASVAQTAAMGNGGGGGHGDDCTGGGGGNGTAGATGTVWTGTPGAGGATAGNAALTSMVFGGGGGGGSENNTPACGPGGNGGGIIFIIGSSVNVSGEIINKGADGGTSAPEDHSIGSGGGAGGSVLIKAQVANLGTSKINCSGADNASQGTAYSMRKGGVGGTGRIHLDYLTSYTGTTTPTLDYAQDSSLTSTSIGSSYTMFAGSDTGKIYSWDGVSTYTEVFDVNRLEWYETGGDNPNKFVGDAGGTESAQAQGFKLDTTMYVGGIEVYLKKNVGTPGDITVRIETDNGGKPSGTLANANLTTTIPAFTETTYAWKVATFTTPASLSAGTQYHIVLKTAPAENDNYYVWQGDDSSPSYSDGTASYSSDGGSTWTIASGSDAYFRVRGEPVGVTCSIISDISASTTKLYFGTGNLSSTHVGNARIYSYDGTNWTLTKVLSGATDSYISSMIQFGTLTPGVFIGVGHKAKIYYTADMNTFTVSKTITEPRNPGYVLALAEYNGQLIAGGGYPEQLYGNNYQYSGFLYNYDEYAWGLVGTFEHTVITSLESFDTMLFVGTINKRLYVYNTATIDKLFEFPWDIQISAMRKWDDKLTMAIAPRPGASSTGHEGIYIFDRNGLHHAFGATSRNWYSLFVFNNNLIAGGDSGYVYITDSTHYQSTGWLQTSYFEASLPSIDKLYKEVTLQFDTLPTGTSISLYYKFKESDSWISLGTESTAGEIENIYPFGTNIYGKKISLKVVLSTTDTTVTPTLKKILTKYQLVPDLKYIWKMTIVCPDNIKWGDNTVPISKIGTACTAGDTTITLTSIVGFPNPNGSTAYASIILADGTIDTFSYTGIDTVNKQLTGIPATGTYALATHPAGLTVKVLGKDIHQELLDLKRTKRFYTFTDIDGLTYTVYFSSYQTDKWVLDREGSNLIENEVPITLLEA